MIPRKSKLEYRQGVRGNLSAFEAAGCAKTRAALIVQYKGGCQMVVDALARCSEAELDARPTPGKWSAREIIHHLADSEMIAAIRLHRLLAAD